MRNNLNIAGLVFTFLAFISIGQALCRQSDQGITSSTHGKYVGKIVFSDMPEAIAFKKEIPGLFKNSFDASSPIYSRIYLEKSIGNTKHNGNKSYKSILMYDLYIDGKRMPYKKSFGMYRHIPLNERTYYTEAIENNDQLTKWTSWRPVILPDQNDPDLKYGSVNIAARCFALALLDQTPGTHQIELKLYARDFASGDETEVLASGSFQITLTAADKKRLAFSYTPPLPKDEWIDGNKEKLKAEIAIAFEKQLNKKPITCGLYGKGWQEGTYSLSGQKYRKLAAWAVFDDTDGDGQVPVTTFNWISDYSNGGWTRLRFDSHCLGCPDWDVEVEAIKASMK